MKFMERRKIVLVTAGGHVSNFHASMKEMRRYSEKRNIGLDFLGARGGLTGLINGKFQEIFDVDIDENRAGSLIGCDREIADTGKIIDVVKTNNIYTIIMMGGDNHLGEGVRLSKAGVRVIGWPKTMDGDLSSGVTLGWDTAVTVGVRQTRKHFNSAMTNGRIFYVGLFGRNTDWVPAAVSLYGGAQRCIPCEQEYEWEQVFDKISQDSKENYEKFGKNFAVVNFSEGARIRGMNPPPKGHCDLDKHGQPKLQPEWVGLELVRLTKKGGKKACFECYTYSMRDEPPTKTDIALARMSGRECMKMVLDEDFGKSVVFVPEGDFYKASRALLEEVAVQKKMRDTDYFDYNELRTRDCFDDDFGRLFRGSLGEPPRIENLAYKNMLREK